MKIWILSKGNGNRILIQSQELGEYYYEISYYWLWYSTSYSEEKGQRILLLNKRRRINLKKILRVKEKIEFPFLCYISFPPSFSYSYVFLEGDRIYFHQIRDELKRCL